MKRELTSSTQCTSPDEPGCTGASGAVPFRRGQSRPAGMARSAHRSDASESRNPQPPTFFHQSARCSPLSGRVISAASATRPSVNTVDGTGATLAQAPGNADKAKPARCDSAFPTPTAVGVNAHGDSPLERGRARPPPGEGASWGQGP